MTASAELATEIRRLFFAEHWKRGTIATQLGTHPDVVERVLGHLGPKAGTPRPRPNLLGPFVAFVDETLAQYPKLVCTRIYDMLRGRGYTGSIKTLRRYVRTARPQPRSEVFLRVESLPGEQAQVDWAHVGSLCVPGGRRSLWAFVMVLAYSRALWAELVLDLDIHSLRRSLVRAAAFFGGVARQWLFDNAKTVVVERRGDAVRFHPDLLDLASTLHAQPRLCAPRKPHEKGKVERAIRYLKERFFAARTFHSVAHGNAQLLAFLGEIADQRPHPRWPHRTVHDVFDEERGRLLPLPSPLPITDVVMPIAADKTAFVRLDTNRYSVPADYARRSITLVASDAEIRLLDGHQLLACHERSWGRHQIIETKEHRSVLLESKQRAREPKGRDRLQAEIPGIDVLVERWVEQGRNIGSMVAKTIRLLDAYGSQLVSDAVQDMISRGTHDPGALAMLCEQRRRALHARPPTIIELGPHVVERDVIPHDLGGYDE
ncbi:MAG: IS21 family transposase [Deltaproteobacteria bacterium]|nr:IS21 family transposase [Deltaproteobacteria bacterium]